MIKKYIFFSQITCLFEFNSYFCIVLKEKTKAKINKNLKTKEKFKKIMTITDVKKGMTIEVETSISSTKVEVSAFEVAMIIGQYMGRNDMSDKQFIEQFLSKK